MQFDTKIAVVVRTDLEVCQKLNVAAFLAGGIAAAFPASIGEPYEDGSATKYLALIGQPRHAFPAGKVRAMTGIAVVLLGHGTGAFEPRRITRIGGRLGSREGRERVGY